MKSKLNPNARKWVRALRSGKFKQTKDSLAVEKEGKQIRHCCLGVACELYINDGHRLTRRVLRNGDVEFQGSTGGLPQRVQKWLGLSCDLGEFGDTHLAELNDKGRRFSTIAKVIESKPEGLFVKGK